MKTIELKEKVQADDRQILDRIMRSETGKQFQKAIEETKGKV